MGEPDSLGIGPGQARACALCPRLTLRASRCHLTPTCPTPRRPHSLPLSACMVLTGDLKTTLPPPCLSGSSRGAPQVLGAAAGAQTSGSWKTQPHPALGEHPRLPDSLTPPSGVTYVRTRTKVSSPLECPAMVAVTGTPRWSLHPLELRKYTRRLPGESQGLRVSPTHQHPPV